MFRLRRALYPHRPATSLIAGQPVGRQRWFGRALPTSSRRGNVPVRRPPGGRHVPHGMEGHLAGVRLAEGHEHPASA